VHLDVSYCEIYEEDSKTIAEALRLNRTIYGLHYQGNKGRIDFKGFLLPSSKGHQETPMSIRAGLVQRISSVSILP
jgi:hypothetical protein